MGDTHGQLADVLHILYHLGPPSGKNRYLFNGDMVDRGSQAISLSGWKWPNFWCEKEALKRGNGGECAGKAWELNGN